MQMLSSLRGDKHEFCLVVIKFNFGVWEPIIDHMALKNIISTFPASFAKVNRLGAENGCSRQTDRQKDTTKICICKIDVFVQCTFLFVSDFDHCF